MTHGLMLPLTKAAIGKSEKYSWPYLDKCRRTRAHWEAYHRFFREGSEIKWPAAGGRENSHLFKCEWTEKSQLRSS